MKPLISVVIASKDAGAVLPRCLLSLAVQDWKHFEVILADGLSKDDTLIAAETLRDSLPALLVDSMRDDGVYEAINRGIGRASGDWIFVLGADDQVAKFNVFSTLVPHLNATKADIVYGDVVMSGLNRWVASGARYAGEVGISFLASSNLCQQAIFYRRVALQADGCFNPKYRVCADWVYLLNAYHRRPVERIDLVISFYATDGLSSRSEDTALKSDMLDILGEAIARRPFDNDLTKISWKVRQCFDHALKNRALTRAFS